MANCADMKEGDVLVCDACGLETPGGKVLAPAVPAMRGLAAYPFSVSGKEMVKK